EAGPRRRIERGRVDRADALEIGAQRGGVGVDAALREILEPSAQRRLGVGVDAERGRPFGLVAEQVPGYLVEDRQRIGCGRLRGGETREGEQRSPGAEAGKGLSPGDGCG